MTEFPLLGERFSFKHTGRGERRCHPGVLARMSGGGQTQLKAFLSWCESKQHKLMWSIIAELQGKHELTPLWRCHWFFCWYQCLFCLWSSCTESLMNIFCKNPPLNASCRRRRHHLCAQQRWRRRRFCFPGDPMSGAAGRRLGEQTFSRSPGELEPARGDAWRK